MTANDPYGFSDPPPPPPDDFVPTEQYYSPPKQTSTPARQPQYAPRQASRQAARQRPVQRRAPSPRRSPRRRGIAGPLLSILLLAFVVYLLFTPAGQELFNMLSTPDTYSYREYPVWAEYTVDRTITLTNTRRFTMMVPEPHDLGNSAVPVQEIIAITPTIINGNPTFIDNYKRPGWSNAYSWYVWEDSTSHFTDYVIKIRYQVRADSVTWDLTDENSGYVDQIDQSWKDRYLGDEWFITPSDTTIQELAHRLTDDKASVYAKLKAIFDWMNDNFEYETGVQDLPKAPLATLGERKGDCDDQSILFASLARAVGIPAWLEFGPLYISVTDTWGGHGWVKLIVPLKDGTNGWVNIDIVNDEFLFRDPSRISEWESDGNGTHLEEYYHPVSGQVGDWTEQYVTVDVIASEETVRVSANSGQPIGGGIPGFDGYIAIASVGVVAAFGVFRRRRLVG